MKGTRILCLLLLACACCGGRPDSAGRPENLLLLTLDTTRADHLGCYGYKQNTTIVLDRLARRGTRFTNAFASVPLTRPSHASILTGLLPHRHGVWSNGPYRLEPKIPTLAELLKGFRTGAAVSSFVLARSFGLARGFQFFDDSLKELRGQDPERKAGETADVAMTWLRQQPPDQRFFLWVHFYDPHDPYEPPEPYASRFPSHYDGEIACMDGAIGRILDLLQNRGVLDKTLVVAAGDHGEGLGDHGEMTHGYYIYDSTMRVPLILAGPGVPAGKMNPSAVSLIDIVPTVLEALGQPAAPKTDGHSLWASIRSGAQASPLPVLMENRSLHFQFGWARISGIRTNDWLWIDAPEQEMYDVHRDPEEQKNLVPTDRGRAADLRKTWQKTLPEEEAPATGQSLSPEEEKQLSSLGYISAPAGGSPATSGPDPKKFAGILATIDDLIRKREKDCAGGCEQDVQKILTADPSNLFALRVQGELLLNQHRNAEALKVLERLRDSYENHPETLSLLALAYERTGDMNRALVYYRKATMPPWIFWPALESVARLSLRLPAKIDRHKLLDELTAMKPASYREVISVARALAILTEYRAAEERYQRALQLNPSGAEALVGLAQMMERTGRARQAIDVAGKVQPPTVESLFVLGSAQAATGQKEAACSNFVEAFQQHPSNSNLLSGLGYQFEGCARQELAARAYEASLQVDPNNLQALYNLARLQELSGNSRKAAELYRRFLDLAPASMDAQRRYAQARAGKP